MSKINFFQPISLLRTFIIPALVLIGSLVFYQPVLSQVDYNNEIQPIFNANCVGCHGGTSGVTLNNYDAVMSSVGNQYQMNIVVPNEPESSPLVDKLGPNPQFGAQMPQGGSLSDEQIQLIVQWIEEGALETPAVSTGRDADIPRKAELVGNYPNPFNPATTIAYRLDSPAQVHIAIYDIRGVQIQTVVNQHKNEGEHTAVFDASNLASGIYFYRLTARFPGQANGLTITQSRKMTLIK